MIFLSGRNSFISAFRGRYRTNRDLELLQEVQIKEKIYNVTERKELMSRKEITDGRKRRRVGGGGDYFWWSENFGSEIYSSIESLSSCLEWKFLVYSGNAPDGIGRSNPIREK